MAFYHDLGPFEAQARDIGRTVARTRNVGCRMGYFDPARTFVGCVSVLDKKNPARTRFVAYRPDGVWMAMTEAGRNLGPVSRDEAIEYLATGLYPQRTQS